MVNTNAKHVYLDMTHLDKDFIKKRFPLIYKTCLKFGVDITKDMVPVSPAAHYIMGGIRTNVTGETSIKGLFAAGEVACTGVHGANRLASNSLLEGLVYGARAGVSAMTYAEEIKELSVIQPKEKETPRPLTFDAESIRECFRQMMWEKVGIIRCRESLESARHQLEEWEFILRSDFFSRKELELKNMLTVAKMIIEAALLREGSVGAHYRSDFKEKGENSSMHTVCQKDKGTSWAEIANKV
jgi:L-aspartate oxidase